MVAIINHKQLFSLVFMFFIILFNTRSTFAEIADKSIEATGGTWSTLNSLRERTNHNFNYTSSIANTLKSRRKDKKSFINKKLKKAADTESLKEFIKSVDQSGLIRKIIRRKIYIPEDSALTLTSQVSRPNIFPNIFNQGEGFIVDAVIEWPLALDLHAFGEAMQMEKTHTNGAGKTELQTPPAADEGSGRNSSNGNPPIVTPAPSSSATIPVVAVEEDEDVAESQGKSFPDSADIIGLERCFIYEKLETGMSIYLDIPKNQSRDCVLRAVCESQMVADYYPDAPTSIFFEVLHLILKPSLSPTRDTCYDVYLNAEKAAYQAPNYCSPYVSKCPLNIAGLFVRNFFPEIL